MTLEGVRTICTYSCKNNCSFCYQKERNGKFLSTKKFTNALNGVDFLPIYFTFQGGEVSFFPEETLKVLNIADKRFPQVFRKSITTSGVGDLEFYKETKKYGITHFSFSLHKRNPKTESKILKLARSGFFTIRVNCFFSEERMKEVEEVLSFCIENDIQLTLCEDLRLSKNPKNSETILKKIVKNYKIERYKLQSIYWLKDNKFRFWVYKHLDNYDYNNLIILPDGSTTITFNDVMDCHGNY